MTSVQHVVAQHYLDFCRKFSLDEKQYANSVKISVILSLRAVNRQRVYETSKVSSFVDWELVNKSPHYNAYDHNAASWVHIIRHFDPILFTERIDDVSSIPRLLRAFNGRLQRCGVRIPLANVAQLFILSNLNNVRLDAAISTYFHHINSATRLKHVINIAPAKGAKDANEETNQESPSRACLPPTVKHDAPAQDTVAVHDTSVQPNHSNSHPVTVSAEQIRQFCMAQADERANITEYEDTLSFCLQRFALMPNFEQQVSFIVQQEATLRDLAAARQLHTLSGRTRLRDMLLQREKAIAKAHVVSPDTVSQIAADSFGGWCTRVRFPNAMSIPLRQKLYFLMCQMHDYTDYINSILDAEVAKRVLAEKISSPQVETLQGLVYKLNFYSAPFQELLDFRATVGRGFALSAHRHLTYTVLMRMYIAAYQRPQIWQQVWQHVQPTLTHTLITNVTAFAQTRPLNQAALLEVLDGLAH
jgi:hypothetical protein